MTEIIQTHNFRCTECGYRYEEKERADKCEAWCAEHKSCNLDITAHGLPPPEEAGGGTPQTPRWRWLALSALGVLLLAAVGWASKANPVANVSTTSSANSKLIADITAEVTPPQGFQSKIALNDAVLKLVQNGVIDPAKFAALYSRNYGAVLPPEIKTIFTEPQTQPILLTGENASIYVNLLWPIGLSNYMAANNSSPINGKSVSQYASTGGWTLGKANNGGVYFNKFDIVNLTPAQEALVVKVAQNSYRSCCNNSTFFQDCNHGSALLGLLALGASQGLTESELYHEAVAFNSFWFPQTYIETALYFKAVKNLDWNQVDPALIMSKDYSSASGWSANVDQKVQQLGLLPQQSGGGSCGV